MSRDCIISRARELIGTPFHHQGRQPNVGLDCAGLISVCYSECGHKVVSDVKGYKRIANPEEMRSALLDSGTRVKFSEIEKADVIWFRVENEPRHLALYTGNSIIHAYYSAGKVVEQSLTESWVKGIVAVFRHRDF